MGHRAQPLIQMSTKGSDLTCTSLDYPGLRGISCNLAQARCPGFVHITFSWCGLVRFGAVCSDKAKITTRVESDCGVARFWWTLGCGKYERPRSHERIKDRAPLRCSV